MDQEWKWLDDPPILSAEGKRLRNVVRVPLGVALPSLGIGYVLVVVGFALSIGLAVAAAGFTFERAVAMQDAAGWWGLAVAIPALIAAAFTGSGVYIEGTERIMKTSPLTLVLLTATFGGAGLGFALGALNQTRLLPWSNGGYLVAAPGLVIPAALCAIVCLVLLALAVPSARAARSEVARVLRMRETAPRHAGVITRRPDPETWDDGGDVPVRYGAGAEERTVVVRLNTGAHRIPVPGSRVIVFTDVDGSILVEIDPEHPPEFITPSAPYESDSSGGGS